MKVKVIKTPVSQRYCKAGDICDLDTVNNYIRCDGCWFTFHDAWVVERI